MLPLYVVSVGKVFEFWFEVLGTVVLGTVSLGTVVLGTLELDPVVLCTGKLLPKPTCLLQSRNHKHCRFICRCHRSYDEA